MKNLLPAILLAFSVLLSGCAAILNGPTQKILIDSNVKGAVVKVDGRTMGKTPIEVKVRRENSHTIMVEQEGYKTYNYKIRPVPSGKTHYNLAPFLVGSVITLATSSTDSDPYTEDKVNIGPLIAGGIISLGGYLIDLIAEANTQFYEESIQANLLKVPEKIETAKSIPVYCSNTIFKINPGSKIGSLRINNLHRRDIKWENELDVTSDELTNNVNKDLKDLGYQVPMATDNQGQLKKIKTPKVHLVGTVEEVKYNITATAHQPAIDPIIEETKTECQFKVKWELYNFRNKQLVYTETTVGQAMRIGSEAKKDIIVEAYQNSLYTLLNNGKVNEHLIQKEEAAQPEKQEFLVINRPVNKREGIKVNEYLPEVLQSVVTLKTPFSHGSGFIISETGHLVTNYHVIEGFDSLKVMFGNGDSAIAKIIRLNEEMDLALLKIEDKTYKPLRISQGTDALIGSEVYAIGTPGDISLGQTISKGIISGKRKFDNHTYLQTDVSINAGNSGGPLIDSYGNVVGVVNAKLMGQGIEGIGFAIPSNEIFGALNFIYSPPIQKK